MTRAKWLFILLSIFIAGCTTARPDHIESICKIFKQYPDWYWSSFDTQKKWGVPVSVQMAIIHQESRFTATAKPPRRRLLGIIPWFRPTSAYGYSQALQGTWARYQRSTGHSGASRNEFADAADFIGWYAHRAHNRLGISMSNARELYLAYHEGLGGYERGTHRRKAWLLAVSRKVQRRAWTYRWQLNQCRSQLKKKPWYRFW